MPVPTTAVPRQLPERMPEAPDLAGMITTTARSWCRATGATFSEDTVQQAWLIALEELAAWDPGYGGQLLPWLAQRVRWRLHDWARETGPLSRSQARANRVARAAEQPDPHPTGVTYLDGYHDLAEWLQPDDTTFDEVLDRLAWRQIIAGAHLTGRQLELVGRYFYAGQTMAQVGAQLGITESRVSQLLTAACARLRRTAA